MLRPPTAVTNAVSWRSEGIRYEKNEVSLELAETLSMVYNETGSVLWSEIEGTLQVKCHLSGMPELRLVLNEKLAPERASTMRFHQCVRQRPFVADSTMVFLPCDGEFQLLQYRICPVAAPPFQLRTAVTPGHAAAPTEYTVRVTSLFKANVAARNVEIWIPLPKDALDPKFDVAAGLANYDSEANAIVWTISRFYGEQELVLAASFEAPVSPAAKALKGCGADAAFIKMRFDIPGRAASGVEFRHLKVTEKAGYTAQQRMAYHTVCRDWRQRLPP